MGVTIPSAVCGVEAPGGLAHCPHFPATGTSLCALSVFEF